MCRVPGLLNLALFEPILWVGTSGLGLESLVFLDWAFRICGFDLGVWG